MTTRAVILALDRALGLGEQRRIDSWRSVLHGAGVTSDVVPLLRAYGAGMARGRWPDIGTVLRGKAVPETLSWSWRTCCQSLEVDPPDVIVAVTLRAFHTGLARLAPLVILDFVDRLSVSYRDRAGITPSWSQRLLFSLLATTTGVVERRELPPGVRTVAAGCGDAKALSAAWVPNMVEVPTGEPTGVPDHDLLFFGNLGYPPNVAAVGFLDRVWPEIQRRRPGTTLLVAGRNPSPAVRAQAAARGWTLLVDFPSLDEVCGRARLAVAPLAHTAGIQNKVLEAASRGLAQVVLPEVMAGLGPGFPARVATDDFSFVDAVLELLDDTPARVELGRRSRDHVAQAFTPERWSPWLVANGLVPG